MWAAMALFGATAGLSACDSDAPPDLRVHRPAWDTLVVVPSLSGAGMWGAEPDSLTLSLADGSGFVIATRAARLGADAPLDQPWVLPFDDAALPSRAPLMVDACVRTATNGAGTVGRWACEQVPLRASPKRAEVRMGVRYPVDGDPDRLVVAARVGVERPASGDAGETRWQRVVAPARMLVRLTADVPGAPTLVAPLPVSGDTLVLSRLAGYDAYWLALQQRLFYGESVRVRVALVRAEGPATAVASIDRWILGLSDDDRRAIVLGLAASARRGLVEHRPVLDSATVGATVDGWRYDRLRRRYEIRLVLTARDTLGRPHRWSGTLTSGDRGAARFAESGRRDSTRRRLDFTFDPRPLTASDSLP